MPNDKNIFVTNGTVPHNASVYVTRAAEQQVFSNVKLGKYVTILGSRQVGKTSLLHRIRHVAQKDWNYASVLLDLSTFNEANLDLATWLSEFCTFLVDSLSHFMTEAFSYDPPRTSVTFKNFLEQLAKRIENPYILILLDEANAVPDSVSNPFYSTIRWMFNARGDYPPAYASLSKYNFVFAGVFEPDKLIRQSKNSPFNVTEPIYLPDFSLHEMRMLFSNLETLVPRLNPAVTSDIVHKWTGGHPHLSQQMASWLADEADAGADFGEELIEKLNNRLLLTSNVKHVIQQATVPDYLPILNRILSGEHLGFTRGVEHIVQLELIGLIKASEVGRCQIRNLVYQSALEQAISILTSTKSSQNPSSQSPQIKNISQTKLLEILAQQFNEDEIKDVCFNLRNKFEALSKLYYEDLPGEGRQSKCRELITYVERRGCYQELVEECCLLRPQASRFW